MTQAHLKRANFGLNYIFGSGDSGAQADDVENLRPFMPKNLKDLLKKRLFCGI